MCVDRYSFTSEYVLKNNKFFSGRGCRLINEGKLPRKEPSATIVWGGLDKHKVYPIMWNIFPSHPYAPGYPCSNRPPGSNELIKGKEILTSLLKLFEIEMILAVGKHAYSQLKNFETNDVEVIPIRHPANGGAREFREELGNVFKTHFQ